MNGVIFGGEGSLASCSPVVPYLSSISASAGQRYSLLPQSVFEELAYPLWVLASFPFPYGRLALVLDLV